MARRSKDDINRGVLGAAIQWRKLAARPCGRAAAFREVGRREEAQGAAGRPAVLGHGADMPMEVFSAGMTDLDQVVMFVVDATRPFSSPARFE